MINLALGFAFLISTMVSPGKRILSVIFETPAIHTISPYVVVLASIFANYWVPTLVIYLVLKGTQSERYLRPNRSIHALFMLANTALCTNQALHVFAATVQGGGATFVLTSVGGFIAVPALSVLIIATVWLAIRSIRWRTAPISLPLETLGTRLRSTGSIVATLMLVPPFAFFVWLYGSNIELISKAASERRAKSARLNDLCGTAVRFDVYRTVKPAKSVFFPYITNATYPMLQELDFVEYKLDGWDEELGNALYVRVRKKPDEPVLVDGMPNVLREKVIEPEAEYEIAIKPIAPVADSTKGLTVEETTIMDRRTNEVLAILTSVHEFSVVDSRDSRFCPPGFDQVSFQLEGPSYVLGLMNERETKEFAKRIEALKKTSQLGN